MNTTPRPVLLSRTNKVHLATLVGTDFVKLACTGRLVDMGQAYGTTDQVDCRRCAAKAH